MGGRSSRARPKERVPGAFVHNRWPELHPCRDHCEHTAKPGEVKPYANYTVEVACEARGNRSVLEHVHRCGNLSYLMQGLRVYVRVRRIARRATGLRFSFARPG